MQTQQTSTASLGFWPSWAHHIGDLVFGANDGIINTFAVVSGMSGTGEKPVLLALSLSKGACEGNPQPSGWISLVSSGSPAIWGRRLEWRARRESNPQPSD